MAEEKIKIFLEKYKNFIPPELFVRRELRKILKEEYSIDIHKKNIRLYNGVIRIDVKPIYRHIIYSNKESILTSIKSRVPKNVYVSDIH